jgi:hypothetical protein
MSFLATLRSGPPPPKVALLPDGLFFTRAIPIAAGATPMEAAAQIELAVEALSPFPLTQLFYGYFWAPGSEAAFVFAAYRRRFTAEQIAEWEGAELVLPAFAALLGAEMKPATTVVLASAGGLTSVHWATGAVPALMLYRPLDAELVAAAEKSAEAAAELEAARATLREELIREAGGSQVVLDLPAAPVAEATRTDREVIFRAGEVVARLSPTTVATLDVRDKAELAALRASRRRDVMLWRLTVGAAAALLFLGLAEIALMGGAAWQKVRTTKVRAQQPKVEKILTSQELANRIDDLATKRLLPWEMNAAVVGENGTVKPADIFFSRVYTTPQSGIYTISIDAYTTNVASIAGFKTQLRALPTVESAETNREQTVGGKATFTLTVTFKSNAIKPGALL